MRSERHQTLGVTLLVLACLGTSLGVVYSSHMCREYYATLQTLEGQRWAAEEDYSRLLLEESTLASPHRVLSIATEQLNMRTPGVGTDRVVIQ